MSALDTFWLIIAISAFCGMLGVLGFIAEKLSKPKAWRRVNKRQALVDYESRWVP